MMLREALQATVSLNDDAMTIRIEDTTPENVARFRALAEAERGSLAVEAWRIGLTAMQSALAQAEQARLKDVGAALMQDLERQLKAHSEAQAAVVATTLASYFDPKDGRIMQRLDEFVRDDGRLAAVLKQHLAPENSVLASTLARNLGETSPLFKLLSPEESEGLVAQLEAKLAETLDASRKSIATDMDPLVKESPIARFLEQLKLEIEKAEGNREKQLKALTKELDANDEASALSKLMKQTRDAQTQLAAAINPDKPDSPMAIIKTSLTALLEAHVEEQKEFQEKTQERQLKFEKEVLAAIQRIETKRQSAAQTTTGGFDFEEAVYTFVEESTANAPYVAERTGATTGAVKSSKKGDLVVRFTSETAFEGARVVVEAKRDRSYNVARALEELEAAKSNRACQVGLFVMSRRHAPASFPRFARYGTDILVSWDEEDPTTDAYLQAGLLCALGLASRAVEDVTDENVDAIADIGSRLGTEVERLEKMRGWTTNITRDAEKIEKEIGVGVKKLGIVIENAKDTLRALKIQARDHDAEAKRPIALDDEQVDAASASLRSGAVSAEEPSRSVSVSGGPIAVAAQPVDDAKRRRRES
ncbi:MAG TPA: hypothetical protein VM889_12810 [Candidatus Thermoplasmatota archaeon]|nr:hypothetical protein [Candidatus Thermoplasmatota archaeon]